MNNFMSHTSSYETLQKEIETTYYMYEQNKNIQISSQAQEAILETIKMLDEGILRVCQMNLIQSSWQVLEWVKQAIILYFKIKDIQLYNVGPFTYLDKIPLKTNYNKLNVRVVPPAVARYGSFMESNVVLMPSYVNIGARIGEGTMIDTWATVGSCAQVGANVHVSGGVGIGGVLEPLNAMPVIIEDGAFIGSRCIIVEGVRIGAEAVLAANTTLTSSTPIVDLRDGTKQIIKGYVPSRAVVLPGVMEKNINGVKVLLSCAYIIGERKASTDKKTSLNQVLRDFAVPI